MANIHIYRKRIVRHASAYIFNYFRMGHIYINGLKSNQTVSRPTLVGQVDNDGTCNGGTYNMPNFMEHGQML